MKFNPTINFQVAIPINKEQAEVVAKKLSMAERIKSWFDVVSAGAGAASVVARGLTRLVGLLGG